MISPRIIRRVRLYVLTDKLSPLLHDRAFLRQKYFLRTWRVLHLRYPRRFTEKLQWLKLYDHRPEFITIADKYEVKDYVASRIGAQYVIPTIAVWNRVEDIDWDALPNQFVLKCTHDSKSTVICHDKATLDRDAAIRKLQKHLRHNFYWKSREWQYKHITPRIICEQYIPAPEGELTDYKFYCFDGHAAYCQLIADRSTCETIGFYDRDWQHQPFVGLNPKIAYSDRLHPRPEGYDEMLRLADTLSAGFPFVRIDLYNDRGHILFGEYTLHPYGGFGFFQPDEWDFRLGDMIHLPEASTLSAR